MIHFKFIPNMLLVMFYILDLSMCTPFSAQATIGVSDRAKRYKIIILVRAGRSISAKIAKLLPAQNIVHPKTEVRRRRP